jgi:hypothetical protein
MLRTMCCALVLMVCAGLACTSLHAQKTKTFTVKVLDGKTGKKVTPDNIEVRVDHQKDAHVEWVTLNDDGTAKVTIPEKATALSIHATYDASTDYYVNCDVSKQKDTSTDTWFPTADVLSQGLVMPNECGKEKDIRNLKIEAKPGEFVLLVRKRGLMDRVQEMR